MKKFSGVITALVTPFRGGEIDYKSLANLLDDQLAANIDGLVVLGTTGESPTVESTERVQLWRFIKDRVGTKAPLIMGTGTNSTSSTIQLTQLAEELGADAALVVTPYYNKPPQRGLVQHFTKVAEAVNIPILLYNVPSRTITSLDLDTIIHLSKLERIVGIKEATGNMELGKSIHRSCQQDFLLTSGDDATFLHLAAVGGAGVISVLSNLAPRAMKRMWEEVNNGAQAEVIFAPYRPLNEYLYCEANPIPIKRALAEKGLLASDELRLPLISLPEDKSQHLKELMKGAQLS